MFSQIVEMFNELSVAEMNIKITRDPDNILIEIPGLQTVGICWRNLTSTSDMLLKRDMITLIRRNCRTAGMHV